MNESVLLYFSEEELALMMELAGGKEYTLFLTNPELNQDRISEALVRLYQRGLLIRTENTFILSKTGAFFHEIRNSQRSVLFRVEYPEQRIILFYVNKRRCWIVEYQSGNDNERCRIRTLNTNEAKNWILELHILPQPRLYEEDVREIGAIIEEERKQETDTSADVKVSIQNGDSKVRQKFELLSGNAGWMLRMIKNGKYCTRIYTVEALHDMLLQCFGG